MFSLLHHTNCGDHPEVFSGFIRRSKAAGMLTRQTFTNQYYEIDHVKIALVIFTKTCAVVFRMFAVRNYHNCWSYNVHFLNNCHCSVSHRGMQIAYRSVGVNKMIFTMCDCVLYTISGICWYCGIFEQSIGTQVRIRCASHDELKKWRKTSSGTLWMMYVWMLQEYIWRTKRTVESSLPFIEPHFDLPSYFYNFLQYISKIDGNINRGCTTIVRQVTGATTLYTVVPNNCGPSVWNLLHITHLAPRILRRWLLDFWKICAPLT